MASVVEVEHSEPKVEGFTVKVNASEARDMMTYIRTYYAKNGYGRGYEKNVGLYNVIEAGLAGKHEKSDYPF